MENANIQELQRIRGALEEQTNILDGVLSTIHYQLDYIKTPLGSEGTELVERMEKLKNVARDANNKCIKRLRTLTEVMDTQLKKQQELLEKTIDELSNVDAEVRSAGGGAATGGGATGGAPM